MISLGKLDNSQTMYDNQDILDVCFPLVFIAFLLLPLWIHYVLPSLAWLVRIVRFNNLMTQENILLTAVPIEGMFLHRSR